MSIEMSEPSDTLQENSQLQYFKHTESSGPELNVTSASSVPVMTLIKVNYSSSIASARPCTLDSGSQAGGSFRGDGVWMALDKGAYNSYLKDGGGAPSVEALVNGHAGPAVPAA